MNPDSYLDLIEQRTEIDTRFTTIQRLGVGGGNGHFSLLFRAYDTRTGKPVALKVMDPNCREPYRLACFEREEALLRELRGQPDIVEWIAERSVFTETLSGTGNSTIPIVFSYYASELARESLADALARESWSAERKLKAFRAMCRSVQRIHRWGIVHRDLKPDNFLLMFDKSIKLSDFGTARRLGEKNIQEYYGPPGDLRYSAPEILAGLHEADARTALASDLFSLGAILFQLFTGLPLGLFIYDDDFMTAFPAHMFSVPTNQRRQVFDGIVEDLVNAHPLPGIRESGGEIPRCIEQRVEELYRLLTGLDYRVRAHDFGRVFRLLEMCFACLRYEVTVERRRRWRAGGGAKVALQQGGISD